MVPEHNSAILPLEVMFQGQLPKEAALMRVLYDEHAAALWRYAPRLTGDPAHADDVVQETLLRASQV